MANIFDVAKQAGVSIATVSRVLSRPDAVAANTRRRVLQAVTQLGYTTNAAGKHLRTQRSDKILVTVPDISNPFYSRVLQSIEEGAGYRRSEAERRVLGMIEVLMAAAATPAAERLHAAPPRTLADGEERAAS